MTTVTCESINTEQMLTADPIDARLVRIGTTGDMWRVAPRVAGARTIIEAHHATIGETESGTVNDLPASAGQPMFTISVHFTCRRSAWPALAYALATFLAENPDTP